MMLRLGDLELEAGRPAVAVTFTDADDAVDVAKARAAGVAIAEMRIDLFADRSPGGVAATIRRLAGLPTLATIRLAEEGGAWTAGEADRAALFEAVLPFADGVDIELRAAALLERVAPQVKAADKLLVVSHHDFESTPAYDVLAEIAARAAHGGADVVKIAAQVNADADIAVLARLLDERPAPNLVVIGMGERGLPTRLMFPQEGSLFTFAAQGERASAPGQIPYSQIISLLGLSPERG